MEATVTKRPTICWGWRGRFRGSLNRTEHNPGVIPGGCPKSTSIQNCRQGSHPQQTQRHLQRCQAETGQDIPPRPAGRSWGWKTKCTRWTGEGSRWRSPSTSPTTSPQNSLDSSMKKVSWSATGKPHIICLSYMKYVTRWKDENEFSWNGNLVWKSSHTSFDQTTNNNFFENSWSNQNRHQIRKTHYQNQHN